MKHYVDFALFLGLPEEEATKQARLYAETKGWLNTPEAVIKNVSEYVGVDIKSKERYTPYIVGRWYAYELIRLKFGLHKSHIAKLLNVHHATVLNIEKKYRHHILYDKAIRTAFFTFAEWAGEIQLKKLGMQERKPKPHFGG
jgi:hypothetical protein